MFNAVFMVLETSLYMSAAIVLLAITGALAFGVTGISQGAPIESNVQAAVPSPAAANKKKDFAGQTLTISYIWDEQNITRFAKMYMQANLGVKIEANSFNGDYNRYEEQVTTRLMAGTADDMLDNWRIHYRDSETNTLLADWYPIMRADPTFSGSDYYIR